MEYLSLLLRGHYLDVPTMIPQEDRTKTMHDPHRASRSRRPRGSGFKEGAAKFLTSLWDMCRSNYDVNHKDLELAQGTRRRHNEFLASKNLPVPSDDPEMDPVPYVNYEMPHICDEMFQGFDVSQFPPARSTRPVPPAADGGANDDDEDEADEEDDDANQFFG